MSKKNGKKPEKREKPKAAGPMVDPRVQKEITAIAIGLLALVTLLGWFGAAGPAGRFLDSAFSALFGITKYGMPFALAWTALRIAFPERITPNRGAFLGIFLLVTGLGALANTIAAGSAEEMLKVSGLRTSGGYVGLLLGYPLVLLAGPWAGGAIMVATVAIAFVLAFNVSLHHVSEKLFGMFHFRLPWPFGHRGQQTMALSHDDATEPTFTRKETTEPSSVEDDGRAGERARSPEEATAAAMTASMKKRRAKPISIPMDLLESRNSKPSSGDVEGKKFAIKKTLENFGVPVTMCDVSVGPTVTQFSLRPADGIKLNRITSLSNDLALALAAHPIRIEAPIPGQSLVGIEVPNHTVAVVSLRDVMDTSEFVKSGSSLTVALGKDVAGQPWVLDIGKMPHMLVAGATGSGKSVCLNAIILSLIYTNSSDDLKLLLIDPKRVELSVYDGIPHLIAPAVTEVPKIINSLKWAIGEMDRRFGILQSSGKRDISSYNASLKGDMEKMPYLVIIIDELADLMVASAAEVETAIIRLAQLARAVGIHLVVATQRPSVDVITGLIKANITARVAFSVASSTDSRTILDQPGAEKLVGRGDSLLVTSDLSLPKRIQGCFVSENEIRRVVQYLKDQLEFPVVYDTETVTGKKSSGGGAFGDAQGEDDELYEEARATVVGAGKASASYLQRRLRIGYARAASLLDLLEARGVIGPGEGAKPRAILVEGVRDEDGVHFQDDEDEQA